MEPEDIMYTFDDLKQILEKLRNKENGCPWDSVQTHESMKKYLVEECGEVLEAIDNQDTENLCEELGDVLYQIMIHCEIEKEQGNFTIDDVVNGICEKMVRRHPRLFGGEMEKDLTWEEIKKREKEILETAYEIGEQGGPEEPVKAQPGRVFPHFSNLFLCFRPMKAIINIQVPVKPGSYERIWGGDSNEDL